MKLFFKKMATLLISVALLAYVIFQLYPLFYSTITTETANNYSAYESVTVDCIVIRNEVPVPLNTSKYVYYTVENGTRVAKNGVIAEFYDAHTDALVKEQLAAVDEEIAALQEIHTLGSSGVANLDILNTQIDRAMAELVASGDAASLSDFSSLRQRLVSLMNKKQTVTGKTTDFSNRIQALQAQKTALRTSYHPSVGMLTAPVAGYFVNMVDGFESLLKVDTVSSMTTDAIHTALAAQPTVDSAAYAGKIVSDYAWYLACVVPGSYATTLAVDKTVYIRLPFVTEEEIQVTVVGCNRGSNGDIAVIFECVNMSEALSAIRRESMEILLVEHTGLRVPKRAITTNDMQEVGVYIRSGDIVRFVKIDQEYSDAAGYVICRETDEKGYLHLYDDIIVGGSNLYDGKLIR